MIWGAIVSIWSYIKLVPYWIWVAVAAGIAILLWGDARYAEGRSDEKVEWEAEVARIRAERDAAMAVAEEKDAIIQAAGEEAIEEAREELDNATKDIPDQELSARQRARVCFELQRQGRRCPN